MNTNEQVTQQDFQKSPPSLGDYFLVFRKRKWTILTVFLITVASVFLKTSSVKPVYESVTKVLIDQEKQGFVTLEEVYYLYDSYELETQYKILSSRSLAKLAFDKLDLAKDEGYKNSKNPVGIFQSHFTIEPLKNSRMVLIRVKHHDPRKTALFADTFAQVYIDQNLQRKLDSVRYAMDWLTRQLASVREKVEKSELELQNYVETNQILHIPKIEEGSGKDGLVTQLETEKARLETELSEFSKQYKEKHPKMIRLQSALSTVNERLNQEIRSVLDLNRKTTQYGILKREVESYRQLYETILEKSKQTNLFEGLRVNNVSIVDGAEIPTSPIYPNKRQNLLMACILGAFLGCGLAFLLESIDSTVKSADDAQNLTGLPVLGSIPDINFLKKKIKREEVELACHLESQSLFAESYRFIRTGIFFSSVDKPAKVILMTSTCPKEGKTTDVINLAITLASNGEKILLIDADLRNPRLHKVLNLKGNLGLSVLLAGEVQAKDAIQSTQVPNLFVLPCGQIPPNPSELLNSQKMRDFLNWARNNFGKVLIDSPPVMAVVDPLILAGLVDGALFVIRSGMTHRRQVLQALNKLSETQIKILGVLLNRVRAARDSNYYPYYYRYYTSPKNPKAERLIASK